MQLALSVPLAPVPGTSLLFHSRAIQSLAEGWGSHPCNAAFSACVGVMMCFFMFIRDPLQGEAAVEGTSVLLPAFMLSPCLPSTDGSRKKFIVSDFKEICLKTSNTYSEREKCGKKFISRQWWKHIINGLLCFAQTINIYWAVHLYFCSLVVACSALCGICNPLSVQN